MQEENAFDFRALFFKFYRYWYFFAITVFIAIVIAFLFNKYSKPIYEVSTTLLVKDDYKPDAQALMGFGMMGRGMQNVNNEIAILSSYRLTLRTAESMGLNVSYFGEKNFLNIEMYKTSPFSVVMDKSHPQLSALKFYVTILSPETFMIEAEGELVGVYDFDKSKPYEIKGEEVKAPSVLINKEYRFGEEIVSEFYKFHIDLEQRFDKELDLNKRMYFQFNTVQNAAAMMRGFDIEPTGKESSILQIKMKGNNVEKSVDFLNALTAEYLQQQLEKKNRIANKKRKLE